MAVSPMGAVWYNGRMQRGFSLVELSIVLVILGLLVGGILGGQSLIRASRLRAVTSEVELYLAATSNFHDRYNALPGDMPDATQYWGAQNADPATCRATASTGILTCDGDASGRIGTMDAGVTYSESHRYWQHLANAGLLDGQYNGVAGAGGAASVEPGKNAPVSRLGNGSGYGLTWWGTRGLANGFYPGDYDHSYIFGLAGGSGMPDGGILLARELENIDRKMDDGMPAFGTVTSFAANTRPACVTSDADTARYLVDNPTKGCAAIFKGGF